MWTDLRVREIPDTVSAGLVVWALVLRTAGWDDVSWAATGLGLAAGLLPPLVLAALGGMGGGDVKLLGALGVLVGWPAIGTVLFGTAVAGAVVAVAVLARRSAGDEGEEEHEADPELPYGPAIAAGLLLALGRGAWPLAAGGPS